jgi:hypothetical protein
MSRKPPGYVPLTDQDMPSKGYVDLQIALAIAELETSLPGDITEGPGISIVVGADGTREISTEESAVATTGGTPAQRKAFGV